jgi:hypothetical protein
MPVCAAVCGCDCFSAFARKQGALRVATERAAHVRGFVTERATHVRGFMMERATRVRGVVTGDCRYK